jgi:hypothetical protein
MVRDWLVVGIGACLLQAFAAGPVCAQVEAPAATAVEQTSAADPAPTPAPEKGGFFSHFNPKTWFAKDPPRWAVVADPFLEMHSGPGVGYPIFHVVGRDDKVELLKRRTDWFYVRTTRQIEGWVHREQMLATLEVSGEPIEIREPTRLDFTTRHWEGGAFAGRFGGASIISLFTGYGITEHLSAELTVSNAIGNVSDNWIGTIGLNHTFAPEWWVSPYVGIGTGVIETKPRSTLVRAEDRTDQIGYVAAGVRGYIARRFLWRFEYRGNVVFTSRNENEEINEWKLGLAFFF